MYTKFYGLKEKPFEMTPDPRFLYLTENYREALAHLAYGVKERKGLTVITGEVGTGKTTLIRAFLKFLSRTNGEVRTAYLFNPKLDATDFLHYICEDFGMKEPKRSKGECLGQLNKFLLSNYTEDRNVVLIIDEAQGLDPGLLEEVRLLTNLETSTRKLLQVILIGQPELDELLNRFEFRQLKQRISLRYRLPPLSSDETKEYIRSRLRRAGNTHPDLFSSTSIKRIYRYTRGIPRLINIVCDSALVTGYATDEKIIKGKIIKEVINHLEGADFKNRRGIFGLPLLRLLFRPKK